MNKPALGTHVVADENLDQLSLRIKEQRHYLKYSESL